MRLSASTIEQLFKDTDYSLSEVRKSKKVKPIRLSLLPNEIKQIENSKKEKFVHSNYFATNFRRK